MTYAYVIFSMSKVILPRHTYIIIFKNRDRKRGIIYYTMPNIKYYIFHQFIQYQLVNHCKNDSPFGKIAKTARSEEYSSPINWLHPISIWGNAIWICHILLNSQTYLLNLPQKYELTYLIPYSTTNHFILMLLIYSFTNPTSTMWTIEIFPI